MMRVISGFFALVLVGWAAAPDDSARREGIAAFKDGHYSVAALKFRRALEHSSDRTTKIFVALTEAALGNCMAALPELVARPEPDDPVLYRMASLAAVKCYSAKHDEANMFSLLQRLRQRFPNDPD